MPILILLIEFQCCFRVDKLIIEKMVPFDNTTCIYHACGSEKANK